MNYNPSELDEILSHLPFNGASITIENEEEKGKTDDIYHYLKSCGYIYLIEDEKYIVRVGLEDVGVKFINSGGFQNQKEKENKDELIKELQRINLVLDKNEKEYKVKIRMQESIIRKWQVISAILGFTTLLIPVLLYLSRKLQ